jgi:hypothetical protein
LTGNDETPPFDAYVMRINNATLPKHIFHHGTCLPPKMGTYERLEIVEKEN